MKCYFVRGDASCSEAIVGNLTFQLQKHSDPRFQIAPYSTFIHTYVCMTIKSNRIIQHHITQHPVSSMPDLTGYEITWAKQFLQVTYSERRC